MKETMEVLIDRNTLREKARELGKRISNDYEGKELVLIGVLKGGFVFLADLMREISIPLYIDFISVSSYGELKESTGVVRIIKDIEMCITDKHVLIIEDIVDTGLTLRYLKELFYTREPASVKICSALDKPSKRKVEIEVDYKGITIPDEFVVGYGLDYTGMYRNLPDVCVLKDNFPK